MGAGIASHAVAGVERISTAVVHEREAGTRRELTPDEIAERLERWRPRVLREMSRRRLWADVPVAEREDQFQDVAFVLVTRRFTSDDHLRRALWTGLGFRARDFWKSARRRETCVGDFYDEVIVEQDAEAPDEVAITAADSRHVDDCLSELDDREQAVYRLVRGDGLSRRKAAHALGVTEADVLRALYSAQRKVDQFVVLLVSGRLCSRRSVSVRALARREASQGELDQARAHLSHCTDCLLAFREYRSHLGRDVAAIAPLPVAVGADHLSSSAEQVWHSTREAVTSLKAHAQNLAGRTPTTSGAAEALAGGGAGAAAGVKLAVGLCVAAAGGGAICASTIGLLPSAPNRQPATERHHHQPRHAATRSNSPAGGQAQAGTTGGSTTTSTQAAPSTSSQPAPQPQPQKPSEFFGGSSSAAGAGATGGSSSSTTTPPSNGGSSSGGSRSSGGGGEFFGG